MRRLSRFWSGLEAVSGLAAVSVEWQEAWGQEYDVGRAFLRPTGQLAASYPCPHPGGEECPRGVVVHGEQDIVAVCRAVPRQCDDVTLTKADVVVWELDWRKLGTAIGRALGLTAPHRPRQVLPGTMRLGWHYLVGGKRVAGYLTIQHEAQALSAILSRLLAEAAPPFVLAAPTAGCCESDTAELLHRMAVCFLPLDECLAWEEGQEFAATDRARELLSGLAADLAEDLTPRVRGGRQRAVKQIEVPSGSRWDDLRLTMDGLKLRYVVGDKHGSRDLAETEFEDRRRGELPNDSWHLLEQFARHGRRPVQLGTSETERQTAKQRISRLRGRLRWLFQLPGDPIANTEAGTYRAVFSIRTTDAFSLEFPDGTPWSAVSITETRTGRIRFTVEGKARYLGYANGQVTEGPSEREAAERLESVFQEHTLWMLGFSDEDDALTEAGQALLRVLRAGGGVVHEPNDPGMLDLGARLCRITGIESPPFRFERNRETWIPEFEANSEYATR